MCQSTNNEADPIQQQTSIIYKTKLLMYIQIKRRSLLTNNQLFILNHVINDLLH